MFITSREKSIIDLIVKISGKHSAHSLAAFLNVSVRTIQRDLKAVEKILNQFDLQFKRTSNDGLIIDGKNEHIYKLIQHLSDVDPTDETPEERKLQLLIKLLHEGTFFKTQVLAKQLGVSITTLTGYLDDLANWLEKINITLTRKRGVGVELIAEEANKRKALAHYFLVHFHEELMESLYLLQKDNQLKGPVLGYFNPHYLLEIDNLVNKTINIGQTRLADSDYIGLIVHICITIQRSENNFVLQHADEIANESTKEYQLMKQLCEDLEKTLLIRINTSDIHFLMVILKGSKLQDTDAISYDSIMLGQIIKNVIQHVSSQLHMDLSKDFALFQGLLAHMEPSIFRLKQQMGLFNPLTGEIKTKYPILFMAVNNSLNKEFKDISFPDDEVAFIVLHFGSALLMNEEKANIHAVVVCPTGIGTSKMLASRIQKEIIEINSVEIKSIKDFETANLNEYDVIISTVRLPFTDFDYILVTPLLSDEDIARICSFLQSNLKQLTSRKQYFGLINRKDVVSRKEQSHLQDVLHEIKDVQISMEAILHNLRVYRKSNMGNHVKVLREMVVEAEQEQLVTDATKVLRQLQEREKKGGLGIPKTNMGLYHCRDESIKGLIFQVSHLDEPCIIKGMDGYEVPMKNLLLMLAPENLSLREQEILSLISTSLIENDVAMMIFSSSNEAMIRKKLEDLFLNYLQNNLIKE
ncbi:BglG family transcription antiterminator [Pseudalkalibacillus decolorationis]|uniref:BglG family transcription antiterminator n=1 Tax=Pseudalkalibacillus decolorationis TaxID=163879 RepID=UPI002149615E|nr:BglG family transcription antiterminator [Pseudalkalibacillus decolorationis]